MSSENSLKSANKGYGTEAVWIVDEIEFEHLLGLWTI